ncbi:hypothetical protein Gohar_021890, partial [Gossypium harknessii]|nr:hypothetical protein [Gossypium harknessii]
DYSIGGKISDSAQLLTGLAEGVTFGGIIRSEINGEWCRLKINLDVQKPLRRSIFVSVNNKNKWWISFKYEKLPTFCFGCGKLGHGLPGCNSLNPAEKTKIKENPPYTMALRAESNLLGKECIQLNNSLNQNMGKKIPHTQYFYTGGSDPDLIEDGKAEEANNWLGMTHGELLVNENKEEMKKQEKKDSVMSNERVVDKRRSQDSNPNSVKKSTWRRVNPAPTVAKQKDENGNKKRKATEEIAETYYIEAEYGVATKRLKKDSEQEQGETLLEMMGNAMQ